MKVMDIPEIPSGSQAMPPRKGLLARIFDFFFGRVPDVEMSQEDWEDYMNRNVF